MRYACLLLISLLFSGLGACSYGMNTIPKDLKEGLSPEVAFKEVIRDPKLSLGKKVLWGGMIFKTTVFESRTVLEIIQKPLGRRDRPLKTDQSQGRFLVEQTGQFLDPAIYENGREITIIGDITKEVNKTIGKMEYRYPYVVASHIHLWNPRPKAAVRPYSPYFYCGTPYSTDCAYAFSPYPYFYSNPHGPYPYGIWPYRLPFFPRHHLHRNLSQR